MNVAERLNAAPELILEMREVVVRAGRAVSPAQLRQLADEGWSLRGSHRLESGGFCLWLERPCAEQILLKSQVGPEALGQLAAEGWKALPANAGQLRFERSLLAG